MATKDEIREARNRYNREHYAKNKEQYKARQQRYWERKAEQLKAERKDEPQETK